VVPQEFAVGRRHLDGYQAVAYGRIREGSSDLDRIQRQQQVASALMAKLSSPRALLHSWTLWRAYAGSVHTNLSLRQSLGLAALVRRVPDDGLVMRSLGDAAVSCSYCEGALLLLDADKAAQLLGEAFGDERAAALAAERLRAAGVTAR
jgi:anionic cell wall polymer biosynthesis LytR-Cps2A-Psr (LCP) family protein